MANTSIDTNKGIYQYTLACISFLHTPLRSTRHKINDRKPASTMAISRWLCNNNTKSMVVKIVHPGGHKELHDRTLLASEIMNRNPKCVVAYPDVFQQPWNIVEPDTMLMLGHKYYVVPSSTVRKLQRHFLRNSPLQYAERNCESSRHNTDKINGKKICACSWISAGKDDEKCFLSMFKTKANSETKDFKNRRSLSASDDPWQPGLESIREELSHSNANNLIREEQRNSND